MASSDEEAAEEPKSRRARPSPASKGAKVSLFPGLNPSAIKVAPAVALVLGGAWEPSDYVVQGKPVFTCVIGACKGMSD